MNWFIPTAPVLMAVIVSSKLCCSNVAQFVCHRQPSSVLLGLLLLITMAKAAYANKKADFIEPFTKNLVSNMQLMYSTW